MRRTVASLIAAGGLALAGSGAHAAATPTLNVEFFADGTIAVTLPDGTPVGSTSGAPTVIPAGWYQLHFNGPGACVQVSLFNLKGPNVNVFDDLSGGENTDEFADAYFPPGSTYTWKSAGSPAVTHTFVTSTTVVGSPPPKATSGGGTSSTRPTSGDIVGSLVLPFRGTVAATVSPAGKVTLELKGKPVTRLAAGRYTVVVSDRSRSAGLTLVAGKRRVGLTSRAFTGTRTASVQLDGGAWLPL
jgi:hypothetical protein